MKLFVRLLNRTRPVMVWIALVCFAAGSLNASTLTFERDVSGNLIAVGINQDKKQVFTYDAAGNLASVVTADMPSAPVLTAAASAATVSLSWPAVPKATGYYLLYAAYPDPATSGIGIVDLGGVTTFSADLWPGAELYVAIQAYNKGVTGDISNIEAVQLK